MTMMQLRRRLPLMALIVSLLHHSYSFSIVSSIHATKRQTLVTCLHAANDNLDDNINLKEELTKYLDIRRQRRADDEAKA
jgi:arginine/lysine/ornithine decarboxylase